jgi:diacylglycerol kinase family enzyme
MTRHLFIVNPTARNAAELAAQGAAVCERLGLPCSVRLSGSAGAAAGIVRDEAASGGELRVYSLGGDGSLSDAVRGAAGLPNVSLTQIPCGTGNDFVRCLGGRDEFLDVERLIDGQEILLDLIDVSIDGKPPFCAVNICSVGVDADVAAGVRRYKWSRFLGSKMPYNLSLLASVIKGVKRPYRVALDGGGAISGKFTIITCCNGTTYGGGFYACPDANPADGRLEFLRVRGIGRLTLMRIVGKYAAGRYKELGKYVDFTGGSSIAIEADKPFYVNFDGETVLAEKAVFSLSKHKLRFVTAKNNKKAGCIYPAVCV